jgi:septal ring factor EnvC (AmiA/AmiB activator)
MNGAVMSCHEKQLAAANILINSQGERLATLLAERKEWREAVATLQSERDANAQLTGELAAMTAERDALAAQAKALRKTIGTVCEGWTLPHDARKVLETALYPAKEGDAS